jgi:type I restriction enzyme S subunit
MKAEDLRKSILQLAIQGKLVKQNPDDEPASALIERIRVEKQRLVKEGKIKKDKTESFIYKVADNSYYEKIGTQTRCIDEEIPFEVPEGWEFCRLNFVCWLGDGKKQTGEALPYLEAKYLRGKSDATILNSGKVVNPNSKVILVDGENSGEVFDIMERGYIGSTFKTMNIAPNIYERYVQIILEFYKNLFRDSKVGAAIPHLNKKLFHNLIIAIPPYSEQKRILDRLDTLTPMLLRYSAVEVQESQLTDTFPDALKKSILQSAIQGKLVAQNPDDEPASVLLDKIRKEKEQLIKSGKLKRDKTESFIYKDTADNSYCEKIGGKVRCIDEEIPFEIPKSWTWTRLGSICNTIHYGYTASASPIGNSKLLRITDIQDNKVDWKTVPYCTVTENESTTYKINNNDILIARTGGTIGKTYLVENLNKISVFASYLIRAVPNSNMCAAYLKLYMESPFYWQQLTAKSMGTGQPNVNGESLKSLLVPLPSLCEQMAIVKAIDSIFAIINKIRQKSY